MLGASLGLSLSWSPGMSAVWNKMSFKEQKLQLANRRDMRIESGAETVRRRGVCCVLSSLWEGGGSVSQASTSRPPKGLRARPETRRSVQSIWVGEGCQRKGRGEDGRGGEERGSPCQGSWEGLGSRQGQKEQGPREAGRLTGWVTSPWPPSLEKESFRSD